MRYHRYYSRRIPDVITPSRKASISRHQNKMVGFAPQKNGLFTDLLNPWPPWLYCARPPLHGRIAVSHLHHFCCNPLQTESKTR